MKRAARRLLGRNESSEDKRSFLFSMLPGNAACAEIGVYKGDFSAEILSKLAPKTLHLIDPWAYNQGAEYEGAWYGGQASGQSAMDGVYYDVERRFRSQLQSGQVKLHRASSTEAVQEFPDEYFDWVYIDGDHLYEAVLQDLELYLPKVKPGGLIAGDDYGKDDHWWGNGVTRAVDDFVRKRGLGFLSAQGHQFVLRKSTNR